VSRDAVFHEYIFPYHPSSTQQYKFPLPPIFPQVPVIQVDPHNDDMICSPANEQVLVPEHTSNPADPTAGSSVEARSSPNPISTPSRITKRPGWLDSYVTMTTI